MFRSDGVEHRAGRVPKVALRFAVLMSLSGCWRATTADASYVTPASQLDHALPAVDSFDLERWEGEWYVIATTFDFWKKKGRTDAKFVYADLPHEDATKLWDVTFYRQRGRARRLMGVDTLDPTAPGHLLWHGVGTLAVARNHWYVLEVDSDYEWAVIGFPKSTLGTPAGLDIIARQPSLDPAAYEEATSWVESQPSLRPILERGLVRMDHHGSP